MAGLFDIFTNKNAQDAADAQKAGIWQGYGLASGNIGQGNQALTDYFTRALQPYAQNYGQAQGGVNQLLAALGVGGSGGAAGGDAITKLLQSTPGYRFQLDQGNENILRNAAATGTTASGATLKSLTDYGQGLANTTYQQFINNLQPFLGASNAAAGGIAGVNTGLGGALNQNFNNLGQLGWTAATDAGKAQANADLANNAASANMWGAIMNGAKLGASILSDERTKTDIEPIGELYDGTNVYRFKYDPSIDPSGKTHVGVMAQEVERTNPAAVKEFAGVKFVDYAKATAPARVAKAMFDAFLKAA